VVVIASSAGITSVSSVAGWQALSSNAAEILVANKVKRREAIMIYPYYQ
jgi:hypothetical protein